MYLFSSAPLVTGARVPNSKTAVSLDIIDSFTREFNCDAKMVPGILSVSVSYACHPTSWI